MPTLIFKQSDINPGPITINSCVMTADSCKLDLSLPGNSGKPAKTTKGGRRRRQRQNHANRVQITGVPRSPDYGVVIEGNVAKAYNLGDAQVKSTPILTFSGKAAKLKPNRQRLPRGGKGVVNTKTTTRRRKSLVAKKRVNKTNNKARKKPRAA